MIDALSSSSPFSSYGPSSSIKPSLAVMILSRHQAPRERSILTDADRFPIASHESPKTLGYSFDFLVIFRFSPTCFVVSCGLTRKMDSFPFECRLGTAHLSYNLSLLDRKRQNMITTLQKTKILRSPKLQYPSPRRRPRPPLSLYCNVCQVQPSAHWPEGQLKLAGAAPATATPPIPAPFDRTLDRLAWMRNCNQHLDDSLGRRADRLRWRCEGTDGERD